MTHRTPARSTPTLTRSGLMSNENEREENDENTVLDEELEDDSF